MLTMMKMNMISQKKWMTDCSVLIVLTAIF